MGQLFSHKVYDRNGPIEPEVVPAPQQQIVTAAPAEGGQEEAFVTARTVHEPYRYDANENVGFGVADADDNRSTGSNRQNSNNNNNGGGCWLVVAAIVLIIVFTSGDDEATRDLGGLRPDSASVTQCPAVFDANNESIVEVGCKTSACGGFIEWCDLGTGNFSLTLSLAGDYNSLTEFMDVSFGSANVTVTAFEQCFNPEEVLVTSATPVGGVLRMTYKNSEAVDNICDDDYASAMRAVLKIAG